MICKDCKLELSIHLNTSYYLANFPFFNLLPSKYLLLLFTSTLSASQQPPSQTIQVSYEQSNISSTYTLLTKLTAYDGKFTKDESTGHSSGRGPRVYHYRAVPRRAARNLTSPHHSSSRQWQGIQSSTRLWSIPTL